MSSRKAGRGRTVATGDTSLSPGQLDSSGGYVVDGPSSAQSSQPSQPLRAASVVDPVDFGGNISRSPSSVSVQGSSLSKGKRPGASKKTKNPATRAVTKKNKAGKGNPVPGSSRLPLSHPLAYCGRRGSPLRVSQCAIPHPAPPNLPRWPWWGTGLGLPTVTRPLMPSGWACWRSVGRLPMPSLRTGVPPVSRLGGSVLILGFYPLRWGPRDTTLVRRDI